MRRSQWRLGWGVTSGRANDLLTATHPYPPFRHSMPNFEPDYPTKCVAVLSSNQAKTLQGINLEAQAPQRTKGSSERHPAPDWDPELLPT